MKLSEIAFRNTKRNMRRTVLSATAIAIAAMAIVMLFSLLEGLNNDLLYNLTSFYNGEVRIRHEEYSPNEQLFPLHLRIENYKDVLDTVEDIEGVRVVSPRISFPGQIIQNQEQIGTGMGIGVDFEKEKIFQDLEKWMVDGTIPHAGEKKTVIGYNLAQKLNLSIGDKFTVHTLTMRGVPNAFTVEITGFFQTPVAAYNLNNFYIPIDRAEDYLGMRASATEILIKADEGIKDTIIEERLQTALAAKPFEVLALSHMQTTVSFITLAQNIYNFAAIFFFLLGSTVVITTTIMVIFERTKEIGTLGAMGMTGSEITKLFFYESAIIGVIGSFVGVALGIVFTLILGKYGIDLSSAIEGIDFEMGGIFYPELKWGTTVLVFFYSSFVSVAATYFPAKRSSKIEPVEALRSY